MRKKGTPVFILSLLLIMLLSSRFSPAREEKLLICGSTCMERLCRALAQAYMAETRASGLRLNSAARQWAWPARRRAGSTSRAVRAI